MHGALKSASAAMVCVAMLSLASAQAPAIDGRAKSAKPAPVRPKRRLTRILAVDGSMWPCIPRRYAATDTIALTWSTRSINGQDFLINTQAQKIYMPGWKDFSAYPVRSLLIWWFGTDMSAS